MSGCCGGGSSSKAAAKLACPNCRVLQKPVSYVTVLHHTRHPYNQELDEDRNYFFCRNSSCNVVYFDSNEESLAVEEVRGPIGQKMDTPSRPICYCFDVTEEQVLEELAQDGASITKEFVKALTSGKLCACEIRNPSGRCCLVDFPS